MEIYASYEVFKRDTSKHWAMIGEFIRGNNRYQPSPAHYALKDLENMGIMHCVK